LPGAAGRSGNPLLAPPDRPEVRGPARPSRPLRLSANRDWIIPVECTADAVALPTAGKRFTLAQMQAEPGSRNPLLAAIRDMIDRRQATVRSGELPYRPQVRFQVHRDGWRAYYLAYPALELLRVPMTRELMENGKE
jgi:hypothetical protein